MGGQGEAWEAGRRKGNFPTKERASLFSCPTEISAYAIGYDLGGRCAVLSSRWGERSCFFSTFS